MKGLRENRPPLAERDKAAILHPFTVLADHLETGPRIIAAADRITLTDDSGKRYLDAASGLWCVNVGYGRGEIADAAAEQMRALSFAHSFGSCSHEPAIRLAERLLELAPGNMARVFFGNSGSDANDTQIKLVWLYNNLLGRPKKKKIIARRGAYHGASLGAGSLTGHATVHDGFDLPIANILHTDCPDYHRRADPAQSERAFSDMLAAKLDALIEAEDAATVAAFIAEPVMGAGGVIPPPEGYFEAITRVLGKHDVLFIADEVITGFGRIGHWFGSEAFGIEPDLITLAKGMTSAYLPMSACLIAQEIWEVLVEGSKRMAPFGHGFTTAGHPVAAVTALKNIEIIEREGLLENARTVGGYLRERLEDVFGDHPLIGDIRGLGLMAAIELDADKGRRRPFGPELKVGSRLGQCCWEEGLIVRGALDKSVAALAPPLVVSERDVDAIVERLVRAVDKLAQSLRAEGLWAG
ncbi:MAG: aminotransferase [Proteobacteria bacterium]|nr:aminotransferase [Pseudomonadota bacterium]